MKPGNRNNHGFTLIEILICIAIMATMIIGVGNAYFHIFFSNSKFIIKNIYIIFCKDFY